MLLAVETRGELTENLHEGSVAVVGEEGIRFFGGRYRDPVFFRSASKPIQAVPVLLLGLDRKYGLTEEELAVMAGSNAGEDEAVRAAVSLMEKAGVTEDDLILGARYPSNEKAKFAAVARGDPPKKIWHGCTPKHVGAILVQRELTGSGRGYHLPDSAAQRLARYAVSLFSSVPYEKIRMGTDGCGVPVFGVPGEAIALSFLRLASPELIPDPYFSAAAERITACMRRHPELVRGKNYLCSLLNGEDGITAKGGAGGVYAFGLREERLGVMFKLYDGTESAWQAVVARILEQIAPESRKNLIEKLKTAELTGTVCRDLKSTAGGKIGELRAEFVLNRAENP